MTTRHGGRWILTAVAAAALTLAGAARAGIPTQPITLEMHDAQVTDVVRLLAHLASLSPVVDPAASGKTITLDLTDVEWEQALDVVLKTSGLAAELEGNILRVAPPAKFIAEMQQETQLREAREQSGPLETRVYQLSWANAADAANHVRKQLSPRGRVDFDKRTNTLIVTDVASQP